MICPQCTTELRNGVCPMCIAYSKRTHTLPEGGYMEFNELNERERAAFARAADLYSNAHGAKE